MTAPRNMGVHNPRVPASTQLQRPINDNDIDGLKIENALLYRRVIFLVKQDVSQRAALERATGTPWDSENLVDLTGDKLDEIVAKNMAHGLNISLSEAKTRVKSNNELANATQVEGHSKNRKTLREKANESKEAKSRTIPTIKGVPVE